MKFCLRLPRSSERSGSFTPTRLCTSTCSRSWPSLMRPLCVSSQSALWSPSARPSATLRFKMCLLPWSSALLKVNGSLAASHHALSSTTRIQDLELRKNVSARSLWNSAKKTHPWSGELALLNLVNSRLSLTSSTWLLSCSQSLDSCSRMSRTLSVFCAWNLWFSLPPIFLKKKTKFTLLESYSRRAKISHGRSDCASQSHLPSSQRLSAKKFQIITSFKLSPNC